MKALQYSSLGIFACSLVACSAPAPVAQNFPLSYQAVARSARHWDVVADDVVAQTSASINAVDSLRGRSVHIDEANRSTVFNNSLRDFMINHFVDRGMSVSVCSARDGGAPGSERDVQVRFDTRVISHAAMPNYSPGLLTALAGGVFVGRLIGDANISRDAAGAIGFGAVAAADLLVGYVPSPTRTELVVTTTIEENNRFVMRRSDVYYIPDGDAGLYTRRVKGNDLCRSSTAEAHASSRPDPEDDAQARHELALRDMCKADPPDKPTLFCTP